MSEPRVKLGNAYFPLASSLSAATMFFTAGVPYKRGSFKEETSFADVPDIVAEVSSGAKYRAPFDHDPPPDGEGGSAP